MSQITPTLWLSGVEVAYSRLFLVNEKITHVLNCADDAPLFKVPKDFFGIEESKDD
jgi:hypothetical protein